MRSRAANQVSDRRAAALLCVVLWAGLWGAPGAAIAQRTGTPPIVIPPATRIAPSVVPPPAPAPPPSPRPQAAAAAGIQPAPRALLPTAIEVLHDPLGSGIVMSGSLTGAAGSASGVLLAIFANSAAFDPNPKPRLVVADQSDRAAQALFAASVHGWPVTGVATAALGDAGGDVAVFYDYAASFPASFARLREALAQGGGTLPPLHLADGATIGLPPGWRVIGQASGAVELAGPLGEFASLGATIPVYAGQTGLSGFVAQGACCDPVAALGAVFPQLSANAQRAGQPSQTLTGIVDQAEAPAAPGGQAALILAAVSRGGRAYSTLALAEAVGGFADPWTFRLSAIAAPQPVFAAELPSLLRIWESYSANPPGLADRLQAAAQKIAALQPMLQAAPKTTADAGVSAAWDLIIPEAAGAEGGRIDSGLAEQLTERLATETGRAWRVVPTGEQP